MKLIWMTDTHIIPEFVKDNGNDFWYRVSQTIEVERIECVIHSGDIADGRHIREQLSLIAKYVKIPFYFVMGNHDFYDIPFDESYANISNVLTRNKNLHWMGVEPYSILNSQTILIGGDGWYDGESGNWERSLPLNDFSKIDILNRYQSDLGRMWTVINNIAHKENRRILDRLETSIREFPTICNYIIVTHVPPFADACRYKGLPSDERGLPVFCNKSLGDKLIELARNYPHKKFNIFCGHTHNEYVFIPDTPTKNITCYVGRSDYGKPDFIILNSL